MRVFLFLIPVALMAQTPAAKSTTPAAASAAKSKSTTATKSTAATKSTVATKSTAAKAAPASSAALTTDEQKEVYAVGLMIARSLKQFDFSPAETEIVKRALSDGAAGKPAVDLATWGPKTNVLAKERETRVVARQKAASKVYLDQAAAEPGAVKTPSGLVYRDLTPGTGASPKATDTVQVNYRGTLIDGTEFDSSYKNKAPFTTPLNRVIGCWTEGVQRMKVGGKAKLVCPSDLAYGDGGQASIPGGAALIFEVELLQINPSAAK